MHFRITPDSRVGFLLYHTRSVGYLRRYIKYRALLLVKAYESNNSRKTMLQVAQLRAARALLGWRQEDLARTAKVGVATIRRIESQQGPLAAYVSTLLKIQAAFEQAGIQFIDDDETGGFGLRMAKKKRKR
jgi:DNA-binding XRE family transcriptional regulator